MSTKLKNLGMPLTKKEQQEIIGSRGKTYWKLCEDLCRGVGNEQIVLEIACPPC